MLKLLLLVFNYSSFLFTMYMLVELPRCFALHENTPHMIKMESGISYSIGQVSNKLFSFSTICR